MTKKVGPAKSEPFYHNPRRPAMESSEVMKFFTKYFLEKIDHTPTLGLSTSFVLVYRRWIIIVL